MYFVYVLRSQRDRKLYTGITKDLKQRVDQHNRGSSATPSTRNRGPFDLLYYEKVENSKVAREREKYFKSGRGREFLKEKQKTAPR